MTRVLFLALLCVVTVPALAADWYIVVSGGGSAVGHVEASRVVNPLTVPKGQKTWYKAATMTKPTPGAFQRLTGPVYDVDAGTITYSVEGYSDAELTPVIEAEANRRILAQYSETTQRNLIARQSELDAIIAGRYVKDDGTFETARSLTASEVAEMIAIRQAWDWIKSVRVAEATLIADPPSNPTLDSHWPNDPS